MTSSLATIRLCRSLFPIVSFLASGQPKSATLLIILSVGIRSDDRASSSEKGRRSLPSES